MQEADEGAQLRLVATSTDADGSGTTAISAATGTVVDPAPLISVVLNGIAQEGKTLAAVAVANSADAVIGYQWQILNGTNWRNIAGAISSTYLVTEANEGHQIRVIASSVDADGGSASATSIATAPVIDVTPTLSVTVSGIAQQGQTLTAISNVGSDGDGGRTTFQWQELVGSSWINITGATRSTYRAVEADEGLQIRATATFTDDTGQSVSAASAPTALVMDVTPTISVTLSGTAQEGRILTARANVTSDGDGGTTVFQWQRLIGTTWTNIAGATGATYQIVEQDEGSHLRVTSTFTDDTGQTASATSAATATVLDVTPTLSVSISGVAQDGQTLTATALANDADAVVSYQWQQRVGGVWTNISGATTSSFKITEANEGRRLRVIATSVDSDGGGASATSAATARVVDAAPTLTISRTSLFVAAGGSVSLPISVSGFDADDRVTVTIVGLPAFETITDALDHRTFGGTSVTLTAAEVNSGLTLHSTYGGTGQPVNLLTVTATNTTARESVSSLGQIVTVTDPPAPKPNIQAVNLSPLPMALPAAFSLTLQVVTQSQAAVFQKSVKASITPPSDFGGGRPPVIAKPTVRLAQSGDEAPADFDGRIELASVQAEMPPWVANVDDGRSAGTASSEALPVTMRTEAIPVQLALTQDVSSEQLTMMMGAQPQRSELMQALFAAGILLPSAAKRATVRPTQGKGEKRSSPRSLCTFDSDTDRLVPEGAETLASFDLPSIIQSSAESDEDEWVYITMDAAE